MPTGKFTRCCGWAIAALCFWNGLPAAETKPARGRVEFGLVTYLSMHHLGTELGPSIKPTAADRTNYLDAVRDLGVTTVRETLVNWAEIQPERGGNYDFEYLDDLVRKASERGIDILALAYFFPPWATVDEDRPWSYPTPNDGRYKLPLRKYEADFRRFVRTAVERYCGCRPGSLPLKTPVRHYVFMNEGEGYAGEFLKAEEYAHWLRVFYEEVKSVDRRARVAAPALAVPGTWSRKGWLGKYLEDLLDAKELQGPRYPYFDILDFHPYPSGYAPPNPNIYGINAACSYLRQVLTAHKLDLPLWVTEIGDNSQDLSLQADRVVKYAVHAASAGVERVYVFGIWDYGKNSQWGLLEDTPSGQVPARKPSFLAYKTLLAKISDNQGVDFLGPGRYRVFRPSQKPLYVLWAEGEYSQVPSFLRGRLRVTDLSNRSEDVDAGSLKLSGHPVLIETLE